MATVSRDAIIGRRGQSNLPLQKYPIHKRKPWQLKFMQKKFKIKQNSTFAKLIFIFQTKIKSHFRKQSTDYSCYIYVSTFQQKHLNIEIFNQNIKIDWKGKINYKWKFQNERKFFKCDKLNIFYFFVFLNEIDGFWCCNKN
jgi:hypothetical protein